MVHRIPSLFRIGEMIKFFIKPWHGFDNATVFFYPEIAERTARQVQIQYIIGNFLTAFQFRQSIADIFGDGPMGASDIGDHAEYIFYAFHRGRTILTLFHKEFGDYRKRVYQHHGRLDVAPDSAGFFALG